IHCAAGGEAIILDADPAQHSAAAWRRARRANWPDHPRVAVERIGEGLDLPDVAHTLAERYDLVLIDTGAMDSAYLRAGLTCAHTLVLPTSSDGMELWALDQMETLMTRARPLNPHLRLVVAASRIPSNRAATIANELRDWLAAHAPTMPAPEISVLVQRTAVSRASSLGLGVTELVQRPDPKASQEAQALYDQVMTP
ncbi:MAG: hypothetical protein ACRYHQ_24290, partial [Janthinobacterium lividum]